MLFVLKIVRDTPVPAKFQTPPGTKDSTPLGPLSNALRALVT